MRGHSSAGRALQWHCRGQGFDSPWLHQFDDKASSLAAPGENAAAPPAFPADAAIGHFAEEHRHHRIDVLNRSPSTPPCGGDLTPIDVFRVVSPFQSAPPCGGDASDAVDALIALIVSIRAPVWGRLGLTVRTSQVRVSIRAPVWGRQSSFDSNKPSKKFQSAPPCGGDALHVVRHVEQCAVSIRAPVWGRRAAGPLRM